jgi:arylsulfatase A-like enzyme
MADDLGYAGLGSYGQRLILTLQIDKMAAPGMCFANFYGGNAVCVTSRVSMLMGTHPGHAPIRDNVLPHLPNFLGYMKEYPGDLWPLKLPGHDHPFRGHTADLRLNTKLFNEFGKVY